MLVCPHHLGQGFYRHAIGEADGGRIVVVTLIPGDIFRNAAQSGYCLDVVTAVPITWCGQQFPVLCHAAVLPDDVPGHFRQADVGFHTCLLSLGFYLQVPVK